MIDAKRRGSSGLAYRIVGSVLLGFSALALFIAFNVSQNLVIEIGSGSHNYDPSFTGALLASIASLGMIVGMMALCTGSIIAAIWDARSS